MPTTVQFRRGTTAQNNSLTGSAGEITVNTSNNTLRVHDGSTLGGTELATRAQLTATNVTGLTTANVTEVTNLYFTNARVSTAVSGQTLTNSTFTGNVTVGGELDVSGNIELRKGFFEFANVTATAVTANITIDLNDSGVVFFTANATANATVNLRGVGPLVAGNAASYALFMTNGATAYRVTTVQIEGTSTGVTTRWSGGTAPASGNASNVDVYAFTVVKTAASTYSVFASQTQFGG